jgi:transposase-like protein
MTIKENAIDLNWERESTWIRTKHNRNHQRDTCISQISMAELTKAQRARIIGPLEAGVSVRETARQCDTTPPTVERWGDRYEETGTVTTFLEVAVRGLLLQRRMLQS